MGAQNAFQTPYSTEKEETLCPITNPSTPSASYRCLCCINSFVHLHLPPWTSDEPSLIHQSKTPMTLIATVS